MRASLELRSLSDVYGDLPDLKIRNALAEIKAGQVGKAAEAANSSLSRPLSRSNAFYDEVNARLSRPGLSSLERENIARISQARLWRDLKFGGVLKQAPPPFSDVQVSVFADGDRIALKCEIAELPEGKAVTSLGDVSRSGAPIYVQDTPGLNNLDWGVSVEKSLATVMDQGLGEVIELPVGRIADFSPAQIVTARNGMKLTSIRTGRSSLPTNSILNPAQALSHFTDNQSNSDDDQNRHRAYFVVAKAAK